MKPADASADLFTQWEGAVAFRLFADQTTPTLTVPEQIAARIGDRILTDEMPPGSRIGEQDLADEFHVSRGPIRDALRILEREGLVTLLARRGAVVTELSATELRELMEIRAGLFEIVIKKLTTNTPLELHSLLEAGTARLEALATSDTLGENYAETTYRLLILCTRLCGNQHLLRMLTALSLRTLRYSKLGLASAQRRKRSAKLWREATRALKAGNSQRMLELTRQRIEESGEEAIRQLQQKSAASAP